MDPKGTRCAALFQGWWASGVFCAFHTICRYTC